MLSLPEEFTLPKSLNYHGSNGTIMRKILVFCIKTDNFIILFYDSPSSNAKVSSVPHTFKESL